jgi:pimeloyl-ACP methyl ester carboxylesterase
VLDALGIGRANFIGHAFGNRLARTYATLYPDYVDKLVLMAAGGNFRMSEDQLSCLENALNLTLPDEERLKAIRRVFFAEANDARVWLNGWYPDLAKAQIMSARMLNGEFFRKAGGNPFLLIQAAEDYIAPPEKAGLALKAELGEQVTYVEIPETGHALSSERPDEIAKHIINYFAK